MVDGGSRNWSLKTQMHVVMHIFANLLTDFKDSTSGDALRVDRFECPIQ